MDRMALILKQWLPIAATATVLCFLVYLAVQQALRESANDPQIQMAEDAAARFGSGAALLQGLFEPTESIDIAKSLAPFIIIYDDDGKAVASTGGLHGQPPSPPPGVFDYVRQNGEERVTWQPEPGVRIASVVVRATGTRAGFVLAGRSLREVEKREARAMTRAGAALLFALGISLAFVGFKEYQTKPDA